MLTDTPMRRRFASATLALALAAGIGAGVGVTAEMTGTAQAAHAASVKGGPITRGEVIARAEYWLAHAGEITYNQSGSFPDPQGDNYRTDCTGYISMALHLSDQPWTGSFPTMPYVTEISRSALKPGDFLITQDGHGILFGKWETSTSFAYYAFGSTPVDYNPGHSFSDSSLDGHPTSGYKAYRYDNIIDGGNPGVDFNADGPADYLIVNPTTGAVTVWINNGGNNRGGWTSYGQVAAGVAPGSQVRFADFNGDGKADYLIVNPTTGGITAYINNGGDGRGGWTSWGVVATGEAPGSQIQLADFNGDGKTDYLIVNPTTGAVTAWINNGGNNRGGWSGYGQVAAGLAPGSQVRFADFNGDGRADYLIVDPTTGAVTAWINNGGDGRGGWSNWGVVATGEAPGNQVRFSDFNGDGKADYLIVDPTTGAITAWINNGGNNRGGWSGWGLVATGLAPGDQVHI
ncbi:VCBS repeat-containing protein [Catellatospora sp. KI3]|uniref:FG-GAP repeat domain-containing protein n=1 Tax=Catellatospora sp. KI3 TaxID=3041620 RepID=UPI002482311E|nr:VCBS repeat-containing protein [Catellatospora sp. KI3]MDI1459817.1 VCBS repeat-containing protein [Catellatospora sp. KI3]